MLSSRLDNQYKMDYWAVMAAPKAYSRRFARAPYIITVDAKSKRRNQTARLLAEAISTLSEDQRQAVATTIATAGRGDVEVIAKRIARALQRRTEYGAISKQALMVSGQVRGIGSWTSIGEPIGGARKRGSKAAEAPATARAPSAEIGLGGGLGQILSVEDGEAKMNAITTEDHSTDWAQSELVGVGELAERLAVVRSTIDSWRTSRKVIAFQKGLRNFVYPLAQFDGLKPVQGLDQVAAQFDGPEAAWEWLVIPSRMLGGSTPLERLREGGVAEVVDAAQGALDFA